MGDEVGLYHCGPDAKGLTFTAEGNFSYDTGGKISGSVPRHKG